MYNIQNNDFIDKNKLYCIPIYFKVIYKLSNQSIIIINNNFMRHFTNIQYRNHCYCQVS